MVAKPTKIGPVGRYSTRIPKGCEFESHCPCDYVRTSLMNLKTFPDSG